jgi:putative heme-binding domain-containing protein
MRLLISSLLLGFCVCVSADPATRAVVKRWTVEDFDAVIFVALEGYRDYENGRRRFSEATCIKCHRFNGEGPKAAVAPDLGKVGETYSPRDLLEAILDPDKTIAPGFVTHHFEMKDGGTREGLVVERTGSALRLVSDPERPDQSETVKLEAIRSERGSGSSAMPTGLLDTFREEDVLDLLAYLLSGGEKSDSMFRK